MTIAMDIEHAYYTNHGSITDPGRFAGLFVDLPSDLSQLCIILQGLLLHQHWAARYGETLSETRIADAGIRHVEKIVARLQEISSGPITDRRKIGDRLVGNCRTFSVLLAAILRNQGKPARARCGFGRYFMAGWHEDHWICEYWSDKQERWILVDAQLDEFQCNQLKVGFDPLDVPQDQFIVGGKAWNLCRTGKADPKKFGIFDMRGLWFVRGNLIRDTAALNKVELLPWDGWGLTEVDDDRITQEDLRLLDNVASKSFDVVDYKYIREAYQTSDGLIVPTVIKSYTRSGPLKIDLSTEDVVG